MAAFVVHAEGLGSPIKRRGSISADLWRLRRPNETNWWSGILNQALPYAFELGMERRATTSISPLRHTEPLYIFQTQVRRQPSARNSKLDILPSTQSKLKIQAAHTDKREFSGYP